MFTVARGLFNFLLLKTISSKSFDWLFSQFHKPWDYQKRRKVTLNQTVIYLNQLLEADPQAISGVIEARVACNDKLANHPSVVIFKQDSANLVGMLGILNGLFGKGKDGMPQIVAGFDLEGAKLVRFFTKDDWDFQMKLVENIKEASEKLDKLPE